MGNASAKKIAGGLGSLLGNASQKLKEGSK